MTFYNVMQHTDLTLLTPSATHQDIMKLIEDACKYRAYSICIPSFFVLFARDAVPMVAKDGYKPKICTVVGFPHGNMLPSIKKMEAAQAVAHGADEIDMVINIGMVKERQTELLLKEINEVAEGCNGIPLKVIVETAMLTDDEKIYIAQIVSRSNAAFIKTSTGYGGSGATLADVTLLKQHVGNKHVKASGGIRTIASAKRFIAAGAIRIGSSGIVKDYEKLFEKSEFSQ